MIELASGHRQERSGFALTVFRKGSSASWVLSRDANLLPPPD
jgi:hypothetical protein